LQVLKILMASRGVVPIEPGCGGAELVAYELARVFGRAGHEVTVVSDVGDLESESADNLEFVAIESRFQRGVAKLPGGFFTWLIQHLVGNLSAAWAVRRLTRRRPFDVVHAHGSLSAILISLVCGLPLVYTEHDAPPWQCRYRRWWERAIRKGIYRALNVTAFRRSDHVVATFESLRDEIVTRWRVPEGRVTAILNGAAETFTNGVPSDRSTTPSPLQLNGKTPDFKRYCLFVGRLTPRKGPDFVVRALAEAEPDVSCVFAGDGPMRTEVEKLAKRLGVEDRVAFLGNVEPAGLAPLYANAELLILPTVSDTSPMVVMEAMACGTPVLATSVAGLPSLVEDWETGFLVHPDNVGELAVALRFLMHDPELRKNMSEKARMRVAERFLWSRVAKQYEHAYMSVAPIGASLAGRHALGRRRTLGRERVEFRRRRSQVRFEPTSADRRFVREHDRVPEPTRDGEAEREPLHA
jgi:glycosyltransferase involved in cell wall biosynthesis